MDSQYKILQKKATSEYRKAIRKGVLKRGTMCVKCGATDKVIHGHHPDYNFPLKVIWLCNTCHRAEHVIISDHERCNIYHNQKLIQLKPFSPMRIKTVGIELLDSFIDKHRYFETKINWPDIFGCLRPYERVIIKLRYGFFGNHVFTLREIADNYRVSPEAIRQTETKALVEIKRLLKVLCGYESGDRNV
jgi:hypothetical protein